MAGHSKFKNIMHRKGIQDAKKAKLFTKVAREITVAVHEGKSHDPEINSKLRAAMIRARAIGLPKEKIQKAMSTTNDAPHHYIRYSAHGPGGVGMIIECLSDNKNRIASEMRSIISKHHAKLEAAEHMFRHLGCVKFACALSDELTELALSAGAEEVIERDGEVEMFFNLEDFNAGKKALYQLGEATYDGMAWFPVFTKALTDSDAEKLASLVEALEDHDDVQMVWTNAE